MRRAAVLAVIASVLGCSGGDRLKPGDVSLVTGGKDKGGVMVDAKTAKGQFGPLRAALPFGTKVRIVDDGEPDDSAKPNGRPVQIQILEGEESGVAGTIPRKFLTAPVAN